MMIEGIIEPVKLKTKGQVQAKLHAILHDLRHISHGCEGKMTADQFAELEQFARLTREKCNDICGWMGRHAL